MRQRLGSWWSIGILIPLVFAVDSQAATKPNIVLITLDSVRADRVGFLGAHGGFTPALDAVAHEGIIFLQAYAQSPSTVASAATILTGSYPQTHRASALSVPLPANIPYLPDLLSAAGYRTVAFVGSIELDPVNGPFQNYDRGFDLYDAGFHPPQRGESSYQSVERTPDRVVARATKWLAVNKQRPFFLWVHLADPHAAGSAYDRATAAADSDLGKLISALRAQSLYDEAVIVVASLHGEALGAHGEETHGNFLYDETIHVPLMMKLPKSQLGGKKIKARVRLLDIAPTILATAAAAVPAQMQGQSLLRVAQTNSPGGQPSYARSDLPAQNFQASAIESWRAGKYLYIRAPRPELYDLSIDPGATHNLAQTSKATLEIMAAQLQALDSRMANGSAGNPASVLTASEMQKLASLGYVGLQKSSSGVSAATQGTDAKDIIGAANRTLAAMRDLDDGKPEKALPVFRQLLAAQPDAYLAQYGAGEALFEQQQYAEAVGYLHKAIELQPDSAWAHYTMGMTLAKTGDFKTGAVHLEIAAGRLPNCSALHAALAEVYERLGRSADVARERAAASKRRLQEP